ncbi:MAG TPA: hypothetical protein VHS31_15980 [Tepidisphaeraceae bacterium]|nr:hypothetical protein [Tepidisphaeraceae bacterium]
MQRPGPNATMMSGSTTFITCAMMLALFAALSWEAVASKCATYDEPVHALGSWMVLRHSDFRIDAENPPLWQHWAALANGDNALPFNLNDPNFSRILHQDQDLRYAFTAHQLYQSPGVDGEQFVRRSRAMMLPIGVALGAIIALWSWRVAGGIAAIGATALFALDPNFLGHAPLVKNDVSLALAMIWTAMALWLVGQRLTWLRAANLALATAAAITIKFNGLIAPFIVALMLIARALLPIPWTWRQSILKTRLSKLTAAAILLVACTAVCYLTIWACYHFRFDPTAEPDVPLEHTLIYGRAQVQGQRNSPIFLLAEWAGNHRLLPQAFVDGVLYQYVFSYSRHGFLCGEIRDTGWWSFYPLAMLFKTPVTTQIAILLAAATALYLLRRNPPSASTIWLIACLVFPAGAILAISMASNVNVGLRHIFSVYPPIYVAVGITAAKLWPTLSPPRRWILPAFIGLLAAESFSAFPDYIAYFNFASGGSRGGINLLGDSNLDWGQDLPLLAHWQAEHPDRSLTLLYFGTVDPNFFHINTTPDLRQASVLAVSATDLQGISASPPVRRRLAYIRSLQPMQVLGGTIYLYNWTPIQEQAMERAGGT